MTTSSGPEGPVDSSMTRAPTRSLWVQPSFLVTFALCALWLGGLLGSSQTAQAARPGFAFLLIATVLGYFAYRRWRGWRAVPRHGWLPSRRMSGRRWVGLVIYLVIVLSVTAGLATQPDKVLWAKSLDTTTCGDWQSVMTDYQRNQVAMTFLAYDRLQSPMPADAAVASVDDYTSTITLMCKHDVGPSSNLLRSWEAGAPPPAP